MSRQLILASSSSARLGLLRSAKVDVTAHPARIDESAVLLAMQAEGSNVRDMADTLAEMKARKIADRFPEALVLGCDQVLEYQSRAWGKPETPEDAVSQLFAFQGQTHKLHSAIVLYDMTQPIWRHVGVVRMTMRQMSENWIRAYVERNWNEIRHSAGGYLVESEGIRLFTAIEGDYFTILGLPLLPLLNYLADRGFIDA
jgi:septum formation protein